jgi:endonuclease G
VFNDQWEVIALHHSGVPRTKQQGEFLDKDGNVWRDSDPTRLDWVANEGIRISRLMRFLGEVLNGLAPDDPKRRYLQELTDGSAKRGTIAARSPRESEPGPRLPTVAQRIEAKTIAHDKSSTRLIVSSSDATVVVPLTIRVALGEPKPKESSPTSVSPGKGAGGLVIEENFAPDPDYNNRPGYRPDFLGFDLPLPKVDNSAAKDVAKLADGGSELKYNHYSVVMNAARRIAFVSAVNVDDDARAQIGREGADHWSFDPTVDVCCEPVAVICCLAEPQPGMAAADHQE